MILSVLFPDIGVVWPVCIQLIVIDGLRFLLCIWSSGDSVLFYSMTATVSESHLSFSFLYSREWLQLGPGGQLLPVGWFLSPF